MQSIILSTVHIRLVYILLFMHFMKLRQSSRNVNIECTLSINVKSCYSLNVVCIRILKKITIILKKN